LINPEHDPDIKGRVERLMGFLRKLAMKRSAPARHVDQHHKTLWLSELSSRTVLDEAAEAGGEFLSVPRVQLAPEPELAHELWSWVDRSGKQPALRDRGSLPDRRMSSTGPRHQMPSKPSSDGCRSGGAGLIKRPSGWPSGSCTTRFPTWTGT
jgi:hypothetical protein